MSKSLRVKNPNRSKVPWWYEERIVNVKPNRDRVFQDSNDYSRYLNEKEYRDSLRDISDGDETVWSKR